MRTPRIITMALVSLCLALSLVLSTGLAGQAEAAQKRKLDFAVLKVWVGKDCKVHVRLGRRGPGRLPAKKLGGKVILGIKVGKRSYTYTFKQVDPAGRLLAGPAVIDFRSPIRVKGNPKIAAMVDPKNMIPEVDDRRNNIARAKGVPTACQGSNARAVLRALKVEKVYLATGGLNVVISKKPGVRLDRATARRIQLRVQSRVHRGSWALDRVLAKGKRGKGGEVHFKTGLKAKPGASVRVSMKLGKMTRTRVFTLAKEPPTRRRARKPPRIPPDLKALIAQRGMKTKGRAKSFSRGIRITLPGIDHHYAQGSTVTMNIHIDAGHPPGSVYFTVIRDNITIPFPLTGAGVNYSGSEFNYDRQLAIPADATAGDRYFVLAILHDGVWGMSDLFSVTGPAQWGPAGEGSGTPIDLRLAVPNRGHVEWIKGNTYTISWQVIGDDILAQTFEVSLEKAGARVRTLESGHAVWHANSRTWTLTWTIPNDIQVGDDYKIRVRPYRRAGEDVSEDNFSIRSASDLSLDWPPRPGFSSTPLVLALRNNYQIRWHATGSYASAALNIRLLSRLAGVPDVALARNIRASTGRFPFPLGLDCNTNWFTPGAGYRVRIEVAGGDRNIHSTSDQFSIVAPSITLRSDQSGRPWVKGQRKIISWIIRNMPEDARLRLVLYKGNESWMDIGRNVRAANLQFVWTVGAEVGSDLTPIGMGGPPPPPPADDYSIKAFLMNCSRVTSQTIQFRIE